MRHGKKFNHLGRTASHRAALLSNMASSLILHKRIQTTVAKAKELRKYVEPMITKSKTDSTNNRRVVFSYLQSKDAIKELFSIVSEKVANRPGGYTRIIKLGNRLGDNAEMCFIELVDFNETMLAASAEKAGKTRRSRRGGAAKATETTEATAPVVVPVAAAEQPSAEVIEEAPVAEVVAEEAAPEVAEEEAPVAEVVAEEAAPEVTEEEAPEAPATEESTEEKGEDA
ncbi:50S ribosomal protein L17 [Aquirufa sp. A-Brett2-W8]|jgi:large subunit ribosomal protein L17